MQLSKMKNIIVLRGMASNVVDEAIVVLKPNVKIKQTEYNSKGKVSDFDRNKKMIVVKEAESTINNYVKKLQKDTKARENTLLAKKYKFMRIFNAVLIGVILMLAMFL